MKYFEVIFHITADNQIPSDTPSTDTYTQCGIIDIARDILCEIAGQAGFEAFEHTAQGVKGYVQTDLFDSRLLDELLKDWPVTDTHVAYTVQEADDKDWNEVWENAGFQPNIIEDRIMIYDAKHAPDLLPSHLINIGIEARQAFGTGTHETTRMAVTALLHLPLSGKQVLDCGCGTGILGIIAAKIGAQGVIGYDIDEWCVKNARHNAQLNNVEIMEILHGDSSVLSHTCGLFDVIVANINRNILLTDMPNFLKVMASNGYLVLSGFYIHDIPPLIERGQQLGLCELRRYTDGEWACIILHMP